MQQIASLHLQAAFVDEYQCHNQLKDWHLKCQAPNKLVCSELQNVKGSLWLVDVLQTQTNASEILLHDKLSVFTDICLEVEGREKDETEDLSVLQKNITFITFTFSCMFL